MKTLKIASLALASASLMLCSCAKTENTANAAEEEINDTNTPLHELKPDYKTPYGELTVEQVQKDMDRVFHYIDSVTRQSTRCRRQRNNRPCQPALRSQAQSRYIPPYQL